MVEPRLKRTIFGIGLLITQTKPIIILYLGRKEGRPRHLVDVLEGKMGVGPGWVDFWYPRLHH